MKRFHRRSRRLCILAALLVLLVLFLRQNVLLDTASRHAILLNAQSAVSYTHLDVYKRQVLGITVPDQTMIDILQRLEFTVDVQADGSWDVSAPLYRDDVESFPDLAEEVIREYGYDHIVPTFLNTASVTNGGLNYDQKQQLKTCLLYTSRCV